MPLLSLLFGRVRRGPRAKAGRGPRRLLCVTHLEDRCVPSMTTWTQRGGDSGHTGYVDVSVNPAAISEAWNQSINYTSSGYWAQNGNRAVAIDGTRVYRTELEGYWASGNYHVMAFDLQTGSQLWNQIVVGNGPVSAPSIANGLVYINRSGHSGISGGGPEELPRLYALSGETGATVMQTTYAAQWASDERPAIDGTQLVAWDGYYGGFSAWNTATLARQWNRSASQYYLPLAAFDAQYVYAYNSNVYRRTDGALVRTIAAPAGYSVVEDPVVAGSGRLIFEVRNTQSPNTFGVSAYDGVTHTPIWTRSVPTSVGAKAVGNGVVAVGSGSQLYILDEATGAQLQTWQAPDTITGEIILTRTHAFVQSWSYYGGGARVNAINLATGQSEWSFTNTLTDETNYSFMDIAFADGRLVLSHDRFIRVFNVPDHVNAPPDAADDSPTTAEDTAATISVLSNDADADGDALTVTAVGAAAHGTAVRNADNTITYTPAANYFGPDSFTYTVSDGNGGTDTATVSVTVTLVNDAPAASSWQFGTDEDAPLADFLRASDIDGDPLTFIVVTPPTHGAVQLDPLNGTFTYTPDADYYGGDSFTFKVNDGAADSNVATVSITVAPVQDSPVAVAGPDKSGNEAAPIAFDGSSSYDADGDPLSYLWDFGDGNTGNGPTPTHAYADNGTYTVTLTVSDGHGNSNSNTLVVTVNNVAPTAGASGPPTGVRGQVRTFAFTAGDVSAVDQAGTFTYTINWGDGSGVQTVQGTASVQVDHVFTAEGSYNVSVTAKDKDNGTGAPTSRPITIGAVEVQGDTLFIGGTTGGDAIVVKALDAAGRVSVTVNGTLYALPQPPDRIVVFAQAGSDGVTLQSTKVGGTTYRVAAPALLFGGAGNDTLDARGSLAGSVLLGGDGADILYGGAGQDILIGGLGSDALRGGDDDDILIGGVTDFGDDQAALNALLAEWNRTDVDYQGRIDHLSGATGGGLNGVYLFTPTTVHDDAATDQLYGEGGRDWFFYQASGPGTDSLNDRKNNESRTQV